MLAVYFLGSLFCNTLIETNKKAAEIAMLVSGITNALILLFVISGTGLLYDTKYVWESVQCGISLLFLVLCLAEIKKAKKIRRDLMSDTAAFYLQHLGNNRRILRRRTEKSGGAGTKVFPLPEREFYGIG